MAATAAAGARPGSPPVSLSVTPRPRVMTPQPLQLLPHQQGPSPPLHLLLPALAPVWSCAQTKRHVWCEFDSRRLHAQAQHELASRAARPRKRGSLVSRARRRTSGRGAGHVRCVEQCWEWRRSASRRQLTARGLAAAGGAPREEQVPEGAHRGGGARESSTKSKGPRVLQHRASAAAALPSAASFPTPDGKTQVQVVAHLVCA